MSKYYFDKKAAQDVINFIEKYLVHVKGDKALQPLLLEDFQKDIINNLFGIKKVKDNQRRYKTAFIFLPRKNGKSTLVAAIILALLYLEPSFGNEFYSAANDREQASIVFQVVKQQIEANPKLKKYVDIFKNSIVYNAKGSVYKTLSSETSTKHGFNATAFCFDELHSMKSGDENLFDILHTSTASRSNSLSIAITTAGYSKESYCYRMYTYAKDVKDGVIKDESFYPVIYEAPEDCDITDPKIWKLANPGLGVSVKKDYLKSESEKALKQVSLLPLFKRLHLNLWSQQQNAFIEDKILLENNKNFNDDIDGLIWYGGLDLASTRDLSSFVIVTENNEDLIVKHWTFIPEARTLATSQKDSITNYNNFSQLIVTPGNVTDYRFIQKKIKEVCSQYNVKSIAYDRWNASQMIIELVEEGLKMSAMGMGYKSLSPPTKHIESKIYQKKFIYNNCSLLRFQFRNTEVVFDPAGNIKIAKDKSKRNAKIDTVMALCIAVGEMLFSENEEKSVYDTDKRGFFVI